MTSEIRLQRDFEGCKIVNAERQSSASRITLYTLREIKCASRSDKKITLATLRDEKLRVEEKLMERFLRIVAIERTGALQKDGEVCSRKRKILRGSRRRFERTILLYVMKLARKSAQASAVNQPLI